MEPEQHERPQGLGFRTSFFSRIKYCTFNGPINITHAQTYAPNTSAGTRCLKPTDASHKRNRKAFPPDSDCYPGTREEVVREILAWAMSDLSVESQHILWVFGYAGCGKSAIAQAVATQLEDAQRLGASFFFFRGAGDRSEIKSLAEMLSMQMEASVKGTGRYIQQAIAAHPGLLESASVVFQFKHLIYDPINAATWRWYWPFGLWRPITIVIDGFDECEDKEEASLLLRDMVEVFERTPNIPLRLIITSRVEDHLHKTLHGSSQVRLLDLVDRTSDSDISIALDAAISSEGGGRAQASSAEPWPTPENRERVIEQIGGSFIFMTTIVRLLFAPFEIDGLTPQERFPLALEMNPGFDGLYTSILGRCQTFPHFLDIIAIIALARRPLCVVEIADFIDVEVVAVVSILVQLHAIIQLPGDDHTPITLWHSSLRDFLNDRGRSGQFFASPGRHERFTLRCIDFTFPPTPRPDTPGSTYARQYIWEHCEAVSIPYGHSEGSGGFPAIIARVPSREAFYAAMPVGTATRIYRSILSSLGSQSLNIVKALTLLQAPISFAEAVDLLEVSVADIAITVKIVGGLTHPRANKKPLTLPSHFLAFITDRGRSGPFFPSPESHEYLTRRCIALSIPARGTASSLYARRYSWYHYEAALKAFVGEKAKQNLSLWIFTQVEDKEAFLSTAPTHIVNDIYWAVISCSENLPHFLPVLHSVGRSKTPLSKAEIAESLKIPVAAVSVALRNLREVMDVPDSAPSPIKHRYPSFCDFLTVLCAHPIPHPRRWQFQSPHGPLEPRETDIVIPVLGRAALNFINEIVRFLGHEPCKANVVNGRIPLFPTSFPRVTIDGPTKRNSKRLQGRRIVLIGLPVFCPFRTDEENLGVLRDLHKWWKTSYPSGKVCAGAVFLPKTADGWDTIASPSDCVRWITGLCGIPSSAIAFVTSDPMPEVRHPNQPEDPTRHTGCPPQKWRDGKAAAGAKVLHLNLRKALGDRERIVCSFDANNEGERAWNVLDSILSGPDLEARVAIPGSQKASLGPRDHTAGDLWLAAAFKKFRRVGQYPFHIISDPPFLCWPYLW